MNTNAAPPTIASVKTMSKKICVGTRKRALPPVTGAWPRLATPTTPSSATSASAT